MQANLDIRAQTKPDINIGIDRESRQKIADGLSQVLADTYTLYLKTQNFHWNVTGPLFPCLHALFEEQYTELANAVDVIAERIRALGFPAPGTYRDFVRLSIIPEPDGVPDAENMILQLVKNNEAVVRTVRSVLRVVDIAQDETTFYLLTERMQAHEKNAWILRSFLTG